TCRRCRARLCVGRRGSARHRRDAARYARRAGHRRPRLPHARGSSALAPGEQRLRARQVGHPLPGPAAGQIHRDAEAAAVRHGDPAAVGRLLARTRLCRVEWNLHLRQEGANGPLTRPASFPQISRKEPFMRVSRALATQGLIPASLLAFGVLTLPAAAAADPVTVMLRSGEKVAGQLEDLENGTLYVRVSRADQRKLPIGDVAVIDFVGGASGLPETELSKARGDEHLL